MPGRLIMNHNGANGVRPLVNGKLQNALDDVSKTETTTLVSHKAAITNGDSIIPGLGGYPTPNGVSPSSPPPPPFSSASLLDLPPELRHWTETYRSLGTLIERVTQECFHGLGNLVEEMAQIQVPVQTALTNGSTNHAPINGVENTSHANQQKKLLMLEFASGARSKFIKLLVLTQWSRNVDDVSTMIDLSGWCNQTFSSYKDVAQRLLVLMNELRPIKEPNPDIMTALSVLSTGQVPWMPELGYLPLKPLTARKILKTLRKLNTLLAIRLNLHEDLIPQLRDYRIADGRATFIFPTEFELDVSISSEDWQSSFCFLDLRFLFTPAPQISKGPLRDHIDAQINLILNAHGLRGACDFIHNFVLTHKISVLRRQSFELSRALWASSLLIDRAHRTLIVQYWREAPQKRSWIEIGINSGKRKGARYANDDAITSCIGLKWVRNGKAVLDVDVLIDLHNLSMEKILRTVITLHINTMMRAIHEKVLESATKELSVELKTGDGEATNDQLTLQLAHYSTVTLAIDPVTGRPFLSPASTSSFGAQRDLERMSDPAADAAKILTKLLCYDIHQQIERAASHAGWTTVQNFNVIEAFKTSTKIDIQRFGFFRGAGWPLSDWVIGYTVSLVGERWFAVKIAQSAEGDVIEAYRPLPTKSFDRTSSQPALSRSMLRSIQQSALRASSFVEADKSLAAMKVERSLRWVPYRSQRITSADPGEPSRMKTERTLPVMCMHLKQLLAGPEDGAHVNKAGSDGIHDFGVNLLQLHYLGFDTDLGIVKLVAKGMMRDAKKLTDILSRTRDDDVAFDSGGCFSLVLRTGLGESCVDRLIAKLRTVGRVTNFAEVLKSRGLDCNEISLSRVVFTYADDQTAELHFSTGIAKPSESTPIKLKISCDNPHRIVASQLETVLNTAGFENFTHSLTFNYALCRALHAISTRDILSCTDLQTRTPFVHVRNVDSFRLTYPGLLCSFDMRARRAREGLEWQIADVSHLAVKEERAKSFPKLSEGLKALFKRVGRGWTGMKSVLVASVDGVEAALMEIDDVVRGPRAGVISDALRTTAILPHEQMEGARKEKDTEVIMLD